MKDPAVQQALTGKPIGSPSSKTSGSMGSETINTLGINFPSGFAELRFTDHSIFAMRITEQDKSTQNYSSNFTFY